MSKIEMVDGVRNYQLMKRAVVNSILKSHEFNRYLKGLFSYFGYITK